MPSERELVQQAIKRDAQAFGELYRQHLARVYRYIFYRVGNETEAEDLTEQVFLKAWEALPRFREQGLPFSAWLYRLAHNLVIDYRRTRHEAAELDEALLDTRPGPDEIAGWRLDIQTLQQAIGQLTLEQQHVLVLRFVQGLSHAETAAIMGKNQGAVRALQHRALAALYELIGDRIEMP